MLNADYGLLLPLLHTIQSSEEHDRQQSIGNSRDQSMSPIPGLGTGDQPAVDDHVDDPMEETENKRHEEARSGILDVDAHAERRPQIPDYSLGDPIQPDVGAGKDVL